MSIIVLQEYSDTIVLLTYVHVDVVADQMSEVYM